jgi:hypothetical protein
MFGRVKKSMVTAKGGRPHPFALRVRIGELATPRNRICKRIIGVRLTIE